MSTSKNEPQTYVDGAGRTRCADTGKEVSKCGCKAHTKRKKKQQAPAVPVKPPEQTDTQIGKLSRSTVRAAVDLSKRSTVGLGDRLTFIDNQTERSFNAEIIKIHAMEWKWVDEETGQQLHVVIDCTYQVVKTEYNTIQVEQEPVLFH